MWFYAERCSSEEQRNYAEQILDKVGVEAKWLPQHARIMHWLFVDMLGTPGFWMGKDAAERIIALEQDAYNSEADAMGATLLREILTGRLTNDDPVYFWTKKWKQAITSAHDLMRRHSLPESCLDYLSYAYLYCDQNPTTSMLWFLFNPGDR